MSLAIKRQTMKQTQMHYLCRKLFCEHLHFCYDFLRAEHFLVNTFRAYPNHCKQWGFTARRNEIVVASMLQLKHKST